MEAFNTWDNILRTAFPNFLYGIRIGNGTPCHGYDIGLSIFKYTLNGFRRLECADSKDWNVNIGASFHGLGQIGVCCLR